MWNCRNVQVQDVKLHNAGFWTSHYYKCVNVKILDVHIYSPSEPVKAPSTDAIDIDACSNVLIKGCYMSVNDDAIALKGGKGPFADSNTNNGENTNIIIEDCEFGFCHAALTLGSESIHNKNILMRNCYVNEITRLLWLKMRPDTPQHYEFVTLKNISGQGNSLIFVKPWRQFFDLQGRKDVPLSYANNITMENIDFTCNVFFDVDISEYDKLSHFTFNNLTIKAKDGAYNKSVVDSIEFNKVYINGKLIE
jgi:polygalacturonase